MASSLGAGNKVIVLFRYLVCHLQYEILLDGSHCRSGNKILVLCHDLLSLHPYAILLDGAIFRSTNKMIDALALSRSTLWMKHYRYDYSSELNCQAYRFGII
jgi:hypothetical protein